nr:helix-turn-helix domain-containing protein [Cohnella zeiphila]
MFLSITPVLTVGLLSSYIAYHNIKSEIKSQQLAMLDQIQLQVNQFMKSLHTTSIMLSTNPDVERSVRDGPGAEHYQTTVDMNEAVRTYRNASPFRYRTTLIYRRFGDSIYSDEYSEENVRQMRLLQILEKMRPKMNEGVVVPAGTFDDQPDLLLYRPVPINSGYTEGVLVLHVDPEDILRFVGSMEQSFHTRVIVVDREQRVLLSSKREEMGRIVDFQGKRSLPDSGSLALLDDDYRMEMQRSPANGWTYVAMTPNAELTARPKQIQTATFLVVGVLNLVWGLIGLLGFKRMYVPINHLEQKYGVRGKVNQPRGDSLIALGAFIDQLTHTNDALTDRLREQSPYFKQGILRKLLQGEMSERELAVVAREIDLHPDVPYAYVIAAEVDDLPSFLQNYREEERAYLHHTILQLMESRFGVFPDCCGLILKTGRIVLLVGTNDADLETRSRLAGFMDDSRQLVREELRFTVSGAVSGAYEGYARAGEAFEEAISLLGHRFVMGHDVTISVDRSDRKLLQISRPIVEMQKQIVTDVIQGNVNAAGQKLSELIAELYRSRVRPETAMGLFANMLGELDYKLHRLGFAMPQAGETDVFQKLQGLRSLPELEQWFARELFPAVGAALSADSIPKQTRTVNEVMQYIQDHLDGETSLQKAADHFQFSVSYLSKIFKDVSGQNFSEFVLRLRMERAKEWLEHTDQPIKDMARRLGYASVPNFNRVFKQYCGLAPGQYRKEKRQHPYPA